jgi:hypothetical protein
VDFSGRTSVQFPLAGKSTSGTMTTQQSFDVDLLFGGTATLVLYGVRREAKRVRQVQVTIRKPGQETISATFDDVHMDAD